jgi:hypothetical protein
VSRYIYIGERLYEWEGVSLFQKVRLPLYFGTNVILDNTERLFVDPVSSASGAQSLIWLLRRGGGLKFGVMFMVYGRSAG